MTGLELAGAAKLVHRPLRPDSELDLIQQRGMEHEKRFLSDLTAEGRHVTVITKDESILDHGDQYRRATGATEAAIRRGEVVICQATFFDGRWLSFADFLLRAERTSPLRPWSYEIADTKLARSTKGSALLQIWSYIAALTPIGQ